MFTTPSQRRDGSSSSNRSHERLDSWKEVAQFFGREVRTVQLWEKNESLPVRRHQHRKLASVFAFRSELEQWWAARSNGRFSPSAPEVPSLKLPNPSTAVCDQAIRTNGVISLPFKLVHPRQGNGSMHLLAASFEEDLRTNLDVELGRRKLHAIALPAKTFAPTDTSSPSFVRTITREFNVDFALCGTISIAGGKVCIVVQLIAGFDFSCAWSEQFNCDLLSGESRIPIVVRIAEAVASHILADDATAVGASKGQRQLAHHAYGIGLHFWNQRTRNTLYKSILYLQDAVELDPTCADAYATLANAYVSLSYHHLLPPAQARQKADEAVRLALLLEPDSLQVQNAFINILLNCHLDRAAAEQECHKLVAKNLANARTFELYSIALGARGQHKQAIDFALEAGKRVPGSHSAIVQLGQACFYARHFEEARRWMLQAVQMKPQSVMNHAQLGRVEAMLGNWNAVLAAFEQTAILSNNSPLSHALLASAYAGANDPDRAYHLLTLLEEHKHEACYPAYEVAGAYALLHQDQDALSNLASACDLGDMKTIFIAQDPALQRLHSLCGFSRIAIPHRAA